MFVAAAGAALVAMVCRISAANPKFTQHHEAAKRIAAHADTLRGTFLAARERDEAAFDAVVAAQRLPKSNDAEKTARGTALEAALHHAAKVPLELASTVLDALRLASQTLQMENTNLISDVGCAAEFLWAAFAACAYNVRINHRYMKDRPAIEAQTQELGRLEREALAEVQPVRAAVSAALA